MRQRPGSQDRAGKGRGGGYVYHDHADVQRQTARGDLKLQHGRYHLPLPAHRIFRLDHRHLDLRAGYGRLHRLRSLRLVVLNGDYDSLRTGGDPRQQRTGYDRVGRLAHDPVVGGQVGFAFAAVYKQRIDGPGRVGSQLHVRRKRRSAQPDDPALTDCIDDLGGGESLQVAVRPIAAICIFPKLLAGKLIALRLDRNSPYVPAVR